MSRLRGVVVLVGVLSVFGIVGTSWCGSAMAAAPAPSASPPTDPIYDYVTTAQQLSAAPGAQIAGVTTAASEVKPPTYNGGYVQKRPYVHVIFWGSEWNEKSGTKEKLLDLYRTISGGGYGRLTSQYFDQTGYISGEVGLTSYTDSSTPGITWAPNVGEVKEEVERAINSQGWSKSYENQYVVLTPPRTPVAELQLFCAYHTWGGGALEMSFTYLPWASTQCERGLEPWASMQVSASHEFAESETDPIPNENYYGWVTATEGGEIGDLCNTKDAREREEIAPGIWAAKLADDYETARNGIQCDGNDPSPERFETHVGQSNVGVHEATLTASVSDAGWPTYYDFEFEGPGGVTDIPARKASQLEFYGFASAGSGFGPSPVSTPVTGLKGNTTYTVRLVATGKLATPSVAEKGPIPILFSGGQTQFTTPSWPPLVGGEHVANKSQTAATVHASINPQRASTTYRIEYGADNGTSEPYTASVPVPDGSVGGGVEWVNVEQAITGLRPETTYSYRVVAANEEGTTVGNPHRFTTLANPPLFSNAVGTGGTGNGQLSQPDQVAVDPNGNVWVADSGNNRVEEFNDNAEYLRQFGAVGSGPGQFRGPRGIAIDAAGNLWVTDGGNDRVEEFTPAGQFLVQYGSAGNEGLSFNEPSGIAVAPNGLIWVVDSGGHRFVEFSSEGHFVAESPWKQEAGSQSNNFDHPHGIAVNRNGEVWIADTGNDRIQVIDSKGDFRSPINLPVGTGPGQFLEPYGIALTPKGNLLISDRAADRVTEISAEGEDLTKPEVIAEFGSPGGGAEQFTGPQGIAYGPGGSIYVANTPNQRLEKWHQVKAPEGTTAAASGIKSNSATLNGTVNPSGAATTYKFEYGTTTAYGTTVPAAGESVGSGTRTLLEAKTISGLKAETVYHYRVVATNSEGTAVGQDVKFTTPLAYDRAFGTAGTGNGQLGQPDQIAVDPAGNVWVADRENNRVEEFNDNAEFLEQFGTKGSGAGQFIGPRGVAVDAAGNLWVTDGGNDRVEEFTPGGHFLTQYGSAGNEGLRFNEPSGIAVAPNGNIWVVDCLGHRFVEFTSQGVFVAESPRKQEAGSQSDNFDHPHGIAIDRNGTVWIADTGNDRIQQVAPSGSFQSGIKLPAGAGPGQFLEPYGVGITQKGNLLVTDRATDRVSELSPQGEVLAEFGGPGGGAEQFTGPQGIAYGPGGSIYVADTPADRLEKWHQVHAPEGSTLAASGIKSNSATLNGTVNPSGAATTYKFEYGTTTAYGTTVPAAGESVGSGTRTLLEPKTISGLKAETVYHYRVVATNSEGTAVGQDGTFRTLVTPLTYVGSFGAEGSGAGQLLHPSAAAADAGGNVWIADTGNNRIEEFNSSGGYVRSTGGLGSGNGQMNRPVGLAVDPSGKVWVVDAGNNRLEKFSATGEYLEKVGKGTGTQEGYLQSPTALAIDPGESVAIVADTGNNRIEEFKLVGGGFRRTIGSAGSGAGQLSEPSSVAVGPNGTVWVADSGNNRVEEFSKTGGFLTQFGTTGNGPGQFQRPDAIALTSGGTVLVGDQGNGRVEEFSQAGEFITEFGSAGSGAGQFRLGSTIGIGVAGGSALIPDSGNSRVGRWE